MQVRRASCTIQEVIMDPNVNNQGAVPPPETQTGETQYFPPQGGYNPQGAAQSATQSAAYTPPTNSGAPAYPPVSRQGPVYPPYRRYGATSERDRTLLALILIGGSLLFLLDQFRVFAFRG